MSPVAQRAQRYCIGQTRVTGVDSRSNTTRRVGVSPHAPEHALKTAMKRSSSLRKTRISNITQEVLSSPSRQTVVADPRARAVSRLMDIFSKSTRNP
jgi:hypothetical protein